jgi:hypothetical protein
MVVDMRGAWPWRRAGRCSAQKVAFVAADGVAVMLRLLVEVDVERYSLDFEVVQGLAI